MVVTFAGADVTIGGARGPMYVLRQKKASLPDFYDFHQCLASGTIFSPARSGTAMALEID
jgi:hypothetical protein